MILNCIELMYYYWVFKYLRKIICNIYLIFIVIESDIYGVLLFVWWFSVNIDKYIVVSLFLGLVLGNSLFYGILGL